MLLPTPSTDPFSMLALAVTMTVLFLAAEVIAHILDRRKDRPRAFAGDDWMIRGSVEDDQALRELSEGGQQRARPPRVTPPDQVGGQSSRREGPCAGIVPQVTGTLRDGGSGSGDPAEPGFRRARSMAHGAIQDGVDVLAVMGGDGMMHLGVNTVGCGAPFRRQPTMLGLIPAGTGNDLCRGIGLPLRTLSPRRR